MNEPSPVPVACLEDDHFDARMGEGVGHRDPATPAPTTITRSTGRAAPVGTSRLPSSNSPDGAPSVLEEGSMAAWSSAYGSPAVTRRSTTVTVSA